MITTLPTLAKAAEQIRSGSLTPLDLVEYCLDRIRRFDDRLQAWVSVDEAGARRVADELARELSSGRWRGPLHGIPVGVKDIIDVAGFPTKAGSPLREKYMPPSDAPLVARLRECGAIILGKTVTTQFACFDPPPTRNPWNVLHTPGGSSSGSAAALAAGMCPLALGSQTGGSITRPAAYCGVVGLKPRYGVLPLDGIVPLAHHLDHPGPLARTAADLQVFWQAYHASTPAPFHAVSLSRPPRLLRLEGFFWNEAAEDVRNSVEGALQSLQATGAEIQPFDWPEIGAVHAAHRLINAVEAAEYHRRDYAAQRELFAPKIASMIDEGLAATAVDYAAALARQRELKRQIGAMLARLDAEAVVCPATATTAPGRDTTGDPKFNSPWSFSGLPVANIPSGLAPNGLPCGIQLIGLGDEAALLGIAAWCEARLSPLPACC